MTSKSERASIWKTGGLAGRAKRPPRARQPTSLPLAPAHLSVDTRRQRGRVPRDTTETAPFGHLGQASAGVRPFCATRALTRRAAAGENRDRIHSVRSVTKRRGTSPHPPPGRRRGIEQDRIAHEPLPAAAAFPARRAASRASTPTSSPATPWSAPPRCAATSWRSATPAAPTRATTSTPASTASAASWTARRARRSRWSASATSGTRCSRTSPARAPRWPSSPPSTSTRQAHRHAVHGCAASTSRIMERPGARPGHPDRRAHRAAAGRAGGRRHARARGREEHHQLRPDAARTCPTSIFVEYMDITAALESAAYFARLGGRDEPQAERRRRDRADGQETGIPAREVEHEARGSGQPTSAPARHAGRRPAARIVAKIYAGDRVSDLLNEASDKTLLVSNLASVQMLRVAELMDVPGICFVNGVEPEAEMIELARHNGTLLMVSPHRRLRDLRPHLPPRSTESRACLTRGAPGLRHPGRRLHERGRRLARPQAAPQADRRRERRRAARHDRRLRGRDERRHPRRAAAASRRP